MADEHTHQTAADVEHELQSAREDLDQTLHEIEIRLTPSHIAHETRHYAEQKLVAVRDLALRRPMVTLLAAIAAGYLVGMNARHRGNGLG